MTRTALSGREVASANATLSGVLRALREDRQLPLWKVAHAAAMDSTLLSKIELGQRLPTTLQTVALAKFFSHDVDELESMRMAERFLSDNGHNPAAAALALNRMQENPEHYFVNNKRTVVNYRAKAVRKSKKKA